MKKPRLLLAGVAGLAFVTLLVTAAVLAQQAVETKWIFEAIGV